MRCVLNVGQSVANFRDNGEVLKGGCMESLKQDYTEPA